MRRSITLICILAFCMAVCTGAVPGLRYADACSLTIINKALPTVSSPFHRVDSSGWAAMPSAVKKLYSYPSGMSVVFRTDSRHIYARGHTLGRRRSTNIPAIARSGLDLYIMKEGKWLFAGAGKPGECEHFAPLCVNMDASMKECMINLPVYDELLGLEVGVEEGARIEAIPSPYAARVVFAGSSITNGSGVSRPGMTYPGRIGRALMVETPNLGASGNFRLEPFFAEILAGVQADAIVLDAFSNPSAEQIADRLMPFVAAVRRAHPHIPLIFLNTLVRPRGNFNLKVRAEEEAKREAAESAMREVTATFDGVYFINPGMPVGDDGEATVDGIHPTDMGFDRILSYILPVIARILQQHGVIDADG